MFCPPVRHTLYNLRLPIKKFLILHKIPFLEFNYSLLVVPTASHIALKMTFISVRTLKSGESEIKFCRIFLNQCQVA